MIKKTKPKSANNEYFSCVELLKKFSRKELGRFSRFVASCYFNSDRYVVTLLNVMKNVVLKKSHFNIALQGIVYESVFEEKIKSAELNHSQKQQLNHKLSALLRLAERFLVIEGLEEHQAYYNDILFQKILAKRQFKLFSRYVKRHKKRLKTQSEKGIQNYKHLYKIERNVLDYLYMSGKLNKQDNLPELIYNMDIAYIIDKLGSHITLLYLEGVSSKKYDDSSFEAIAALTNLEQYNSHPLVRIYLAAIDLTKTQSEVAYRQFLFLLDKHSLSLSKEDLNGFYVTATNFCARQIQSGQFGYQKLFELYKTMDKKNLLVEANYMPVDKLRTFVAAGCRVGEFDWTLQMIEKYQPFIEKSVRESVYHFNLGGVAFYRKDYEKALHHFIRVESVNLNYDVNCRVIMMKTHYECDKEYDERTIQIFRSAEKYFNENKQLTTKNKKAYKNFIRTLINVYRIRFGATKMKLEDLKEKLELQKVNSDKAWLMEKVEEMKNR